MSGPGLIPYLIVGALLFGIGVAGVLSQRNAIIEVGFTLRCFQRLSHPDVANQQRSWQND